MKKPRYCKRCLKGNHRRHWYVGSCGEPLGKDQIDTALRAGWCACERPTYSRKPAA